VRIELTMDGVAIRRLTTWLRAPGGRRRSRTPGVFQPNRFRAGPEDPAPRLTFLAEGAGLEPATVLPATRFPSVLLIQPDPFLVERVGFEPTSDDTTWFTARPLEPLGHRSWYGRQDSNLHALRHVFLRHACLPLHHSRWCPRRESNSHARRHRPLRPTCLPFHHSD
jgi:hypothetical protein